MLRATQIFTREFDRVFFTLSPSLRSRIGSKISDVALRLETYPHIRLQGRDEFKLRIGEYRVIYEFDVTKNELFLLAMGHRRDVYR
jgi:mRNA interferase RelE/StbE